MKSKLIYPSSFAQSSSRLPHHRFILAFIRRYSAPLDNAVPASKQKYVPTNGTYPRGFLASGIHVGVKANNTRTPDLALIASTAPCAAAAVFTKNKFQAAPVTVSRGVLEKRKGVGIQAIVINSGCANAVTGKGGMEDAASMGAMVDRCLDSHSDDVEGRTLVMSTGVIGQRLPIEKILNGIPKAHAELSSDHTSWLTAATAICTTDTFPKLLSERFTLPSHPETTYHLAGMTKGAGMIHPNMATLLGIICTDACIAPSALNPLLRHAAARSFNSISIDGDTSTNDTVAFLANGAGSPSTKRTITSTTCSDYESFRETLTRFTQRLAHLVVRDGEGATKFVTVRVTHAPSYEAAHAIAASIARSPLVKTALYGGDANWGRILCAAGYTPGLDKDVIDPSQTSVSFVSTSSSTSSSPSASTSTRIASASVTQDETRGIDERERLPLLINGEPQSVDEAKAAKMLAQEDLEIVVRLRSDSSSSSTPSKGEDMGAEATYWTCDFSHEYVTINGDYRT